MCSLALSDFNEDGYLEVPIRASSVNYLQYIPSHSLQIILT